MKKSVLFCAVIAVFAIVSIYAFALPEQTAPKLTGICLVGPNSIPENTQNIYRVVAVYDNGSNVEVTVDSNINIVASECKVINIGGIIETFKLEHPEKQFTIYADYRDFKTAKSVTVYSHKRKTVRK